MPVTRDKPAPYPPAKTVLSIIRRHRERGFPAAIDADSLLRASIPETLIPRVLQSLRTLDLIDDSGMPTATFESIRLAPEAEYKKRLEDWLKGTYADIFSFVDPTKDGEIKIRDAFRGYQPVAQQARMVTLFIGLCTEAGLIAEKTAKAATVSVSPTMRATAARLVRRMSESHRSPPASVTTPSVGLPAPLAGLLASLPSEGRGWTQPRRDLFVTAFTTVLDYCFPILPHDAEEDDAGDE